MHNNEVMFMQIIWKGCSPGTLKIDLTFSREKILKLPGGHSQNISSRLKHYGTKITFSGKLPFGHERVQNCFNIPPQAAFQCNRYWFTGSAKATSHAQHSPLKTEDNNLPEFLTTLFILANLIVLGRNLKNEYALKYWKLLFFSKE